MPKYLVVPDFCVLSLSLSNKHTYITIETSPNAMYKNYVPH